MDLPVEVTTFPYSSYKVSSVTFPPFYAENIAITAYPQESSYFITSTSSIKIAVLYFPLSITAK